MKILLRLIVLSVLLTACSSEKRVVFVTKTSLSILEADSKPAGVSIAYDRVEGYLGPRYENGAVPPVFAAIESDGKIFNPRVSQLYATGLAAEIATTEGLNAPNPNERLPLSGNKKVMFFGTATTTGLKVGVTGGVPDSFVFGYRRKEFSYIPLGTGDDGNDTYPSVLAAIHTKGEVGEDSLSGNVSLSNKQFFATGVAAEHIAALLRPAFLERAKNSVGNPAILSACYSGVPVELRINVWQNASNSNLFFESDDEKGQMLKMLSDAHNQALSDMQNIDLNRLARANSLYLHTMRIDSGLDDIERSSRLSNHTNFVCALSELNQAQ